MWKQFQIFVVQLILLSNTFRISEEMAKYPVLLLEEQIVYEAAI